MTIPVRLAARRQRRRLVADFVSDEAAAERLAIKHRSKVVLRIQRVNRSISQRIVQLRPDTEDQTTYES